MVVVNETMWDKVERMLGRYGLATLLALGLTIWLVNTVSADISDIRRQLSTHVTETNIYLRQICINTASTDAQRYQCYPVMTADAPATSAR